MKKSHFKSGLVPIVVFAMMLTLTAPVQAFDVKVSGQVNQLIMFADNGFDSDFFVADNDNSSTRFRFTGDQEFNSLTIGYKIELEAQRNASNKLDIGNNSDGAFEWNDRWLEAYFLHKWGKLSIGKGDGAANNTSEVDLSGTAVITYAGVNDTAGGFTWTFNDGTKITRGGASLTIGDTRSDFDGLSRNERLRYDTPKFAGLSFAGSVTNGEAYELSGWYAGEFKSFGKLAAALGYVDTRDRETPRYKQMGGSVSWLNTPTGLNVTLSLGQRDPKVGPKAKNGYVKVGWKFAEIHAVSAEFGQTKDLDLNGDKSSNWGAGYVVTPWQGVELYGALRSYSFEQSAGPNPQNVKQIMAGTRIKF